MVLFFCSSWAEDLPSPPVKADVILSLSNVVFSPGSEDSWKTRCLWHEVIASLDEWSGDIHISWKDLRKVDEDSAWIFRHVIVEADGFKEKMEREVAEKLLRMRARQAVVVLLGAPHHDNDHRHQLTQSMDEIAGKATVSVSKLLPIELRKGAEAIIKDVVKASFQEMLSAFSPIDIRRLILNEDAIFLRLKSDLGEYTLSLNECEPVKVMSQEYSKNRNGSLEQGSKELVEGQIKFVVSSHVGKFLSTIMTRNLSTAKESEIGLLFAEPWRARMNALEVEFRLIRGKK